MADGTWQVTHGRWQMTAPIFAEAQFPFFALIFLGGQAGFPTVLTASAVSGSSPHKQARRRPDPENHWEPMRNRALPSVMAFVAQATGFRNAECGMRNSECGTRNKY